MAAEYTFSTDDSIIHEELEVLESIYIDELQVDNDDRGHPSSITLQLHPATGEDVHKKFVCMTLTLNVPVGYPNELPEILIRNPRGVGEEELESLHEAINELAEDRRGGHMLYDIIELAKESLTEGNVPHCPCTICLDHFCEGEEFTRTECYHYFHRHCLYRYVSHTLTTLKSEANQRPKHGDQGKEDNYKVLCPVCREIMNYDLDLLSLSQGQIKEDNRQLYKPSADICKWQVEMAAILESQKQKGGIIDLEEEKNKFLVTAEDTVELPQQESGLDNLAKSSTESKDIKSIPVERKVRSAGLSGSGSERRDRPRPSSGHTNRNQRYRDHRSYGRDGHRSYDGRNRGGYRAPRSYHTSQGHDTSQGQESERKADYVKDKRSRSDRTDGIRSDRTDGIKSDRTDVIRSERKDDIRSDRTDVIKSERKDGIRSERKDGIRSERKDGIRSERKDGINGKVSEEHEDVKKRFETASEIEIRNECRTVNRTSTTDDDPKHNQTNEDKSTIMHRDRKQENAGQDQEDRDKDGVVFSPKENTDKETEKLSSDSVKTFERKGFTVSGSTNSARSSNNTNYRGSKSKQSEYENRNYYQGKNDDRERGHSSHGRGQGHSERGRGRGSRRSANQEAVKSKPDTDTISTDLQETCDSRNTLSSSRDKEGVQRDKAGVQHTSPRDKAGVQHTSPRDKAGVQHTSPRDKAGVQHTSPRDKAGVQHTSPRDKAGVQHTSPRDKAGVQHTSPRDKAGVQHTSARDKAGVQHTSPRDKAGVQHTSPCDKAGVQHTSPRDKAGVQRDKAGVQHTSPRDKAGVQHTSSHNKAGVQHTSPRDMASDLSEVNSQGSNSTYTGKGSEDFGSQRHNSGYKRRDRGFGRPSNRTQNHYDSYSKHGTSERGEVNGKSHEREVNGKYDRGEINGKYDRGEVRDKIDKQDVNGKSDRGEVNCKYDRGEVNDKHDKREVKGKYDRGEVKDKNDKREVNGKSDREEVSCNHTPTNKSTERDELTGTHTNTANPRGSQHTKAHNSRGNNWRSSGANTEKYDDRFVLDHKHLKTDKDIRGCLAKSDNRTQDTHTADKAPRCGVKRPPPGFAQVQNVNNHVKIPPGFEKLETSS